MASLSDMQKIVQSAYPGKTLLEVGGFKLLFSLPTIKFYIKDQVIIVSIRGTYDSTDVASWPNVATGTLDRSSRFQTDLQTLLECQKYYPQSEYYYVGAGHSLGAAIMDRFLQMGLLSQGLSYNGAVEPQFVYNNPKHHRIYNAADPLYNIVGRFIPGVEVRSISIATGLAALLSPFYTSYQAHMLSNFQGGLIHRKKVLKKYGLTGSQSLEDLSEATGVSMSVLQQVYNRGIGAYKTNPASVRIKGSFKKGPAPMSQKLSKEQWAMGRVYSFLDGNKKHDTDLR